MKMKIALGLIAMGSTAWSEPPAPSGGASGLEAWQTDYGAFLEAYRNCMKDSACNLSTWLSGKKVSWQGEVVRGLDRRMRVTLEMTPDRPKFTDREGVERTLVCCRPQLAGLAGWSSVKPGQRVRFNAVFATGDVMPPVGTSPYAAELEAPFAEGEALSVTGPKSIVSLMDARIVSVR